MQNRLLNDNWKFWNEKNSFALVWNVPEDARDIELPHDAMHSQKPYPESPNGVATGFRDGGIYVYVKQLEVDETMRDRKLILKFEGVYMNAFVYINEQLAGKCPNGYSTFHVEMNDFLRYGEQNEIRVIVRNGAMSNSRWYSGGGIYRNVWLLESGLVHLAPEPVRIHTDSLDDDFALIIVSTDIQNDSHIPEELVLEHNIEDETGRIVASEQAAIFVPSGQKATVRSRIGINEPETWNTDSPHLYTCRTSLFRGEKVFDESNSEFGIRTIQVDTQHGLRINGESVNLRGACIHHDSGILGAATWYDAQYRQVKKLKEAGFNALRMAHNTMAPAMLTACDRLGMFVMDETFDMWTRCKSDYDYGMSFTEFWESDADAIVRKDYNHPSVILYSIGNEIPEIGTDHGSLIARKMSDRIKSLDPTRYTLAGINGVFASGDRVDEIVQDVSSQLKNEGVIDEDVNHFMALMADHMDRIVQHPIITERLEKACAATDIAGYNYMTSRYENDIERYPNRVIVGSENYPPKIAANWEKVSRLSHVIGDFTWTGWDYIGEAGVGIPAYAPGEGGFSAQYPCQLAYCGDFDLIGDRRPLSYLREIVYGFRSDPFIAVQNPHHHGRNLMKTPWILSDATASWNWPGCEADPIVVEVYSPGDEVELFLNGESLGRESAGEAFGYRSLFECVYAPGVLEAVAYADGREIGRTQLRSAGNGRRISAEVETGIEDGLLFIGISVLDAEGNLAADEDGELTIELDDSLEFLGAGTSNPKPKYNYDEQKLNLFNGRGMLVVRRKAAVFGATAVLDYHGTMKLEVEI